MPEIKPLDGKVALVTGASKGIGAATAKALAAAGAHVVLTGRDVKALEAVEDAIHEQGGSSTIAPLDLMEQDGVPKLAFAMSQRWDKLDILVVNAAYLPTLTPTTQINPKQFGQAMTINVLATQALISAFDPMLKRAGHARVVGLTSTVGAAPRAYWAAYGATKAAFDNLLESYASEVEKLSDIRVVLLNPGATRTDMRAKAYPGEDPATVKPPEDVASLILDLVNDDIPQFHRVNA